MSRHFKIMSRHKTKLKIKKLYRDKEILCRDIFKSSKNEMLSQQSFYVATQDIHVVTITRQLKPNSVTTFSKSIAT